MARLYCEAEINERLATLRNPSEITQREQPHGVRITHGVIRLDEYQYLCDRCNNPIEPGQQAILVEYFNGWVQPTERYEHKFFKPRTIKEEVILYGTQDY